MIVRFAIQNKATSRYVTGTSFSEVKTWQKTSKCEAITWSTRQEAEEEFKRRKCGKSSYKIVQLNIGEGWKVVNVFGRVRRTG